MGFPAAGRVNLAVPLAPGLAERIRERLYAQVVKTSGCWLWTGYRKVKQGYGALSVHNRLEFVHRLSYAIDRGPIPAGMKVCHECDVPNCIRPEHFFLGTHLDNMADMVSKGRAPRPPVHWGEDHPGVTLTDVQVAEIRSRWAARPRGQRRLAAEYGVSQSTIWRLVHEKVRGSE